MTEIYNSLARTSELLKDFDGSLTYLNISLAMFTEIDDKENVSLILINMASVYKLKTVPFEYKDLKKALECLQKSLQINAALYG